MKRTGRSWIATGVALTAALVLGGCSDGGGQADGLVFGAVPDEAAELTVWSFLPGNYEQGADAYAAIIDAFQDEYPQVTVDLVEMPYPTYFDQVRNATV